MICRNSQLDVESQNSRLKLITKGSFHFGRQWSRIRLPLEDARDGARLFPELNLYQKTTALAGSRTTI